jgi:hypothetical protein
LFDRQTIRLVALRSIVLLTHPGTEQVARLRQEESPLLATPDSSTTPIASGWP